MTILHQRLIWDLVIGFNGMKGFWSLILIVSAVFSFGFMLNEKAIDKVLKKSFKNSVYEKKIVAVPDSLKATLGELYSVNVDGKVEGYVCYATAFGCKVGGCAKPNDPNLSAYETFDYIVVFNKDLSIRNLEIANYPGAYGYEICRKSWLNQFIGKTPALKLYEDVDGVSGATISAQFLVEDLNFVKSMIDSLK
jgi:hypothetical protein